MASGNLTHREKREIRPIKKRLFEWMEHHYDLRKKEPKIETLKDRVAFRIYADIDRFTLKPGAFTLRGMVESIPDGVILSVYKRFQEGDEGSILGSSDEPPYHM